MIEIDKIEQLFDFTVTSTGHRRHCYSGDLITVQTAQKLIDNNPDMLSWQDADQPDCGLNDGVLYLLLALPVPEEDRVGITSEDTYYTFFCIDTKSNDFSIV